MATFYEDLANELEEAQATMRQCEDAMNEAEDEVIRIKREMEKAPRAENCMGHLEEGYEDLNRTERKKYREVTGREYPCQLGG